MANEAFRPRGPSVREWLQALRLREPQRHSRIDERVNQSKSEERENHSRVQRGSVRTDGGAPRGGEEDRLVRFTGEAVKAGPWWLGCWVSGSHTSGTVVLCFFFF